MKKYALTALTVAFCTVVSTVGYGANFADINNIPWAASYINSVYDSGIMVGDYNTKGQRVFRGGENMTYSEAAQLIYSIVVKSNFAADVTETGINKYSMEMTSAGIASWANKSVAFCMEKGIINSFDLTKFKTSGKENKITREDMAVYFGRALALNYPLSTGTSLTFADTSSISASAKSYVELLNKNGIVAGDNNNKFNPKNNITRAEVAVMASKTLALMKKGIVTNPESGNTQTIGVVASIGETNGTWLLRIITSNGTEGFVLNSTTPVYINASNNVGPKGIGLGDTLQISHINAEISKIVITKDVVVDSNIVNSQEYGKTSIDKGELISAGNYKIGIIDKSDRKVYYAVSSDADITLDGKKATMRQLSDMVDKDSKANAVVTISSTTGEAIKVEVTEKEESSSTSGKITSINRKKITIKSGTKSYTYDFADSVSYTYDGSSSSNDRISSAFDKADDDNSYINAKLTLNSDDEVKKVVATSKGYDDDDDSTYKGTIKSFDGDSIKVSGSSKTFDLSSSTKISIAIGGDNITDEEDLEDIIEHAEVYAKITVSNGKVKKIDGYVEEIEGTVSSMTVTNASRCVGKMWIQVKGYGDEIEVGFDSDTTIRIDGTEYDDVNIESLKKYINNHDGEVEVTVKFDDDGAATSIKD